MSGIDHPYISLAVCAFAAIIALIEPDAFRLTADPATMHAERRRMRLLSVFILIVVIIAAIVVRR
jgi:hypothetical protein